jgi:hypothetical protein
MWFRNRAKSVVVVVLCGATNGVVVLKLIRKKRYEFLRDRVHKVSQYSKCSR